MNNPIQTLRELIIKQQNNLDEIEVLLKKLEQVYKIEEEADEVFGIK